MYHIGPLCDLHVYELELGNFIQTVLRLCRTLSSQKNTPTSLSLFSEYIKPPDLHRFVQKSGYTNWTMLEILMLSTSYSFEILNTHS